MSTRIKAFQGDTITIQRSALLGFDGAPIADLSTWELTFTLKASLEDADPGLIQKTKSDGQITVTGGTLSFEISATESRTNIIPATTYQYDIQGRDALGRVKTLEKGRLSVRRDITTDGGGPVVLFDSISGNFDDQLGNFDDL
jgi:hypothetical protein